METGLLMIDAKYLKRSKEQSTGEEEEEEEQLESVPVGERRAKRPHSQPYDEIRIVTVPRFKESHASGSEWRTSKKIQILRKGIVIDDDLTRDAVNNDVVGGAMESWRLIELIEEILKYNLLHLCQNKHHIGEGNLCDQESCAKEASVTYRVKKEFFFYRGEPSEINPQAKDARPLVRKFCAEHAKRGDCGIDDCDDNYEQMFI